MKELFQGFFGSLNNILGDGWSGRKMSALALIACIVAIHITWIVFQFGPNGGQFKQLEMLLVIDFGFISGLFGMTTYQNVKKEANKTTPDENSK